MRRRFYRLSDLYSVFRYATWAYRSFWNSCHKTNILVTWTVGNEWLNGRPNDGVLWKVCRISRTDKVFDRCDFEDEFSERSCEQMSSRSRDMDEAFLLRIDNWSYLKIQKIMLVAYYYHSYYELSWIIVNLQWFRSTLNNTFEQPNKT